MPRTAPHRRPLLAAALVLSLLLAACGGGDAPADDDAAATAAAEPAGTEAAAPTEETAPTEEAVADGAFPVTIPHLLGETTVESVPERVVTIGFNEQDFALALGVVPVATREYTDFDYRARPWAQDALDGAEIPEVGGQELNIEAVAAADPDLILGTYSFIDQGQYDQLSAIAPTVADLAGDAGEASSATWQQQLEAIGQALGLPSEAADLTEAVEGEFAAARDAHPGFEGQTLAVDFTFEGAHFILDPEDIRFRFFADLGFVAPETTGEISPENLELLEADVLVVIGAEREAVVADPVFAALDVVEEDRTIFFGPFSAQFPGALGFGSPLSLPYALELALPPLEAAADGDPSTAVGDATS